MVNLVDRAVEIHTEPGPLGYRHVRVARRGEAVTLVTFADVSIEVVRFLR